MPNYAYSSSPFSGFTTSPWASAVSRMSPFTQGYYDTRPDEAVASFLRTTNPSLSNQDIIRRMVTTLTNQWTSGQLGQVDAAGGQNLPNFTTFLKNYNWDRELARYSPSIRNEGYSNFNRPVRTVTF